MVRVGVLGVIALTTRAAAQDANPERMPAYLAALSLRVPEPAASVLARIDGDGRTLLAVRAYLRAGPGLAARWSWSDEQIALYQSSDQQRAALAEVDKVKTRFAELNPGYELYVNTQVRSLDVQLARWNENPSVGAASEVLLHDATRELGSYPVPPDPASVEGFRRWIEAWRPASAPTLAAPGLSAHGQSYAFDFQIQQGMQIVAGTDSTTVATVWDGAGWTERLAAAVAKASPHFRGPLATPREPWHYTYVP